MTIDMKQLPDSALIDTGVLIRALGDLKDDPRSGACIEFFKAMIAEKKRLLLAAPSFAEFLRKKNVTRLPSVDPVTVVPFDGEAARMLAKYFPASTLRAEKQLSGQTDPAIKFDQMIIACAVRHKSTHLVSLDTHQRNRANEAGLIAKMPADFEEAQGSLRLVQTEGE